MIGLIPVPVAKSNTVENSSAGILSITKPLPWAGLTCTASELESRPQRRFAVEPSVAVGLIRKWRVEEVEEAEEDGESEPSMLQATSLSLLPQSSLPAKEGGGEATAKNPGLLSPTLTWVGEQVTGRRYS